MNKTLIAEFVGWGFPWTDFFTDAQINAAISGGLPRSDVFRRVLPSGSTIEFPDRAADGTVPNLSSDPLKLVFPTNRSFGCVEGMWMDLYIGDGPEFYKFGTLVIESVELAGGGNVELAARIVDISPKGIEDIDTDGGGSPVAAPEHSFFFLYLPRTFCTDRPENMLSYMRNAGMNIGEQGLTNFPFDPIISNFQTQLSQEVDIRGGIASSSGFTFSCLYEGRQGNTEPSEDPLPRRCDATQNLEVLLGQNKHTWGSRRILNPESGNAGIRYRRREFVSGVAQKNFDTPSGQGFIPVMSSHTTGSTPYWREAFTMYWGNDTTDFAYASDPATATSIIDVPTGYITPPGFSSGVSYLLIPDAFGNSPSQPPPQGAEAWSTPPAGVGRRVRLWVVDRDAENPLMDAERVFEGYVDDWTDSDNNTTINISLIDVLSWLRTNRQRTGYKQRTEFSNSLNDRYRILQRGDDLPAPNLYRNRPFDLHPELEFWEDTGDLESDGLAPVRLRPQWASFAGYAFPHSRIMELGGLLRSYAVTQLVNPEIDFTKPFDEWNEDAFEALVLRDLDEIPAKTTAIAVRKLGVALDEEEESFDYDNSYDLEVGVDRISFTNNTPLIAGDLGSRNSWVNVMHKVNIPHGYLQLPNKPFFDWMGYANLDQLLPDVRKVYEYATDISIAFTRGRDNRVACVRWATFAYGMLARKIVREYLEDAEPIHVFFSSDDKDPRSAHNLAASLNETDIGPANTRRTGRTQATLTCQITLAELILQVLTSTGTYSYRNVGDGSRHAPLVNAGDNGPWDTLPKEWGMAIPLPFVDTDQILSYRFIPYTNPEVRGYKAKFAGGPAGVTLDDIFLENVYCTWDDSENMADWLTDHILQPLGLALVCTPQGKIQIRTLDSFDEALFDPATGNFRVEGVLEATDLHSDNADEPPYVSLSQRSTDIIQNFVVRHDDGLNRYSTRFPDVTFPLSAHLPVTRYENSTVTLSAQSEDRAKFAVPMVRTSDLTTITEGAGTPYLSIFGLVEKPTTYFHRRVGSGFPYLSNAEVLRTMRTEKVNRWQIQRPEIQFEIAPWWVGNQVLTAGTSILVDLPNVPNIDGSRGIVGVVLVLSVQYDIMTGVRIINGRVVAQSAPIPPAFANKWMPTFVAAASQAGMTSTQIRYEFPDPIEYSQTLFALGAEELDNPSGFPSRMDGIVMDLCDQYGQIIDSRTVAGIVQTDTSTGVVVIEYTTDKPANVELGIYQELTGQSATPLQNLSRSGAFNATAWRFT